MNDDPVRGPAGGLLPARYRHPEWIARGSMGEVLRATDSELGRAVAVKVMARELAGDDVHLRRFRREAVSAARIDHPNVARVYDVGQHAGRPYIVMEYVAGGDLARRIALGRPSRAQALTWIAEAAAALDAAHAAGIVHRDVKPSNVLLDEAGHVKVADFGIARLADDEGGTLTALGTVLGSSGYVSPEAAQGGAATRAGDVYGLAAVAFELLTGERPYAGRSGVAEMAAHVYEPIPSASERYRTTTGRLRHIPTEGLPPRVDAVLARGLAKDPAERHPSAGAFAAALAAAAGADATVALPAARGTGGAVRRRPRALRLAAASVAAVLLALLAGAGLSALVAGDDDPVAAGTRTLVTTAPAAPARTVVQTVTRSITPAPVPAPATEPAPAGTDDGTALTDRSTAALSAGDPATGLALADRALTVLGGTGAAYEGNASYNRGRALIDLGRCPEAVQPLEDSLRIGGSNWQMRVRRDTLKEARRCARGKDD